MKNYLIKKGLDERSTLFIVGICSLIAAGILTAAGESINVPFSKALAEITIFIILQASFPETSGMRWRTGSVFLCVAIGIFLAAAWIILFALPAIANTKFAATSSIPLAPLLYGLSGSLVSAPLFEEKVARHMILGGLSGMNPLLASSLVSGAFAFAHPDSFIWVFSASMLLCFAALRLKMSTTQRAISHGLCNLLITAWYFTNAYGIKQS